MTMTREYSAQYDVYARTVRSEQVRYYRGLRYAIHFEQRRAVIPGALFSTMVGTRRHVYAETTYSFSDEPLRFFVDRMHGNHYFRNTQTIGVDEEFGYEARAHAAMLPTTNEEAPF